MPRKPHRLIIILYYRNCVLFSSGHRACRSAEGLSQERNVRTNRKTAVWAAAVATSSLLTARHSGAATTYLWNGTGTTWSTASAWTPAGPPSLATDVVSFDNTGVAALANTADSALTGTQFQQLLYRQDGGTGNTYTTSIDRG